MTDSYVDMHSKNTFSRTCSRLRPPACLYHDVSVCAWVWVCVCVYVRVFLWHEWKSHATGIDEACRTYGWVMSHIWMCHGTYMNESHHTFTHPGVKMRENSHEIYQECIDELHMSHISMVRWITYESYLDESMNYTSVIDQSIKGISMNCIWVMYWWINESHEVIYRRIAYVRIDELHMRVSMNCIWYLSRVHRGIAYESHIDESMNCISVLY